MPWQLLRLCSTPAKIQSVEQTLLDAGALSVTLLDAEDQAVFQLETNDTPLWDHVSLSALFDAGHDLEPLLRTLKSSDDVTPGSLHIEPLADQNWETVWMDRFQPLRFGRRLWVCPGWLTPPDPTATNLILDPGIAFGTGTHTTTALCLEWLEQQNLTGKLVIDYGSGSGILGIAAALLGASRVLAVDNDSQAVAATRANRDVNGLTPDHLDCFLPEEFRARTATLTADILVANILAGSLADLAPEFGRLVRTGGILIMSGILADQCEGLLESCRHWFAMDSPEIRDGWARLSGTRR